MPKSPIRVDEKDVQPAIEQLAHGIELIAAGNLIAGAAREVLAEDLRQSIREAVREAIQAELAPVKQRTAELERLRKPQRAGR
jgi:hypothetical protein